MRLQVPRVACEVGAASDKFPTSWLFKHRWTQKGKPAVEGGHAIEFSTVGGRVRPHAAFAQQTMTSWALQSNASAVGLIGTIGLAATACSVGRHESAVYHAVSVNLGRLIFWAVIPELCSS